MNFYPGQNKDSTCAICTSISEKYFVAIEEFNVVGYCKHISQACEREMRNIKEVNVEAYKYLIAIPPRFVFYP